MALFEILTAPDPRLLVKAHPVEKVGSDIRKLIDNLLDTLYYRDALGLAATQVGISKRVIVVNLGEKHHTTSTPFLMVNPEIQWASATTQVTQEGCFSVPGFYENVTRPLEVHVSYLDENNKKQHLEASGLLADCIQHEIDHLNGILFIEHLSSLKRNLILNKLRKKQKK